MKRRNLIALALTACIATACFTAVAAMQPNTAAVTVSSGGTATVYSGRTFNGNLRAIVYTKTDFADGVDFTITSETTGQTLWTQSDVNAAAIKYPLTQACSTAGVAATLNGTQALLVPVALVNERIKIVIAQGGDTKTGAFTFIVDGQP